MMDADKCDGIWRATGDNKIANTITAVMTRLTPLAPVPRLQSHGTRYGYKQTIRFEQMIATPQNSTRRAATQWRAIGRLVWRRSPGSIV